MKISINYFIFLSICFSCSSLFAQDCDVQSKLQFELQIEQTSIGCMDPIFYTLKLNNISNEDVSIIEPWDEFLKPFLEIKLINDTMWVPLKYSNKEPMGFTIPPHENFDIRHKIILSSNTGIAKNSVWAPFLTKLELENYCLNRCFQIRAVYYPCKEIKIISNETTFKIVGYKNEEDKEAADWLKELEFPGFLYEPLIMSSQMWGMYSMKNKRTQKDAENFLKEFPNSKFTPWVKLHLAYFHKVGITEGFKTNTPRIEEAKVIVAELEKIKDEHFQIELKKFKDSLLPVEEEGGN